MEATIPHTITAEQAAGALGITVKELADNLTSAVQTRLGKLGAGVASFQISSLDEFDEEIAGIRRLVESTFACWAAVDAQAEGDDGAA